MNDQGKERTYFDEFGKPYVLDEKGNRRPPMQVEPEPKELGGFTTFPTEQGHCALCGRLACNGSCFK